MEYGNDAQKIINDQFGDTDFENMDYLNEVKEETSGKNITSDSFFLLSVIGMGSYAKVYIAKKRDNGKIYAIKSLKKKKILGLPPLKK